MDRIGLGGAPIPGVGKLQWSSFLIDLELSAYVTGGIPIPQTVTGFTRVFDMFIPAGKDPYGVTNIVTPTDLTVTLVGTDTAPLLYFTEGTSGTQAVNASTIAGEEIWITLGGLR